MIVAHMATFPGRSNIVEGVAKNISQQVDRLHICLNDYSCVPRWLKDVPNIYARVPRQDMKDVGKFIFRQEGSDVVFLVDDDIVYPEDYVAQSLYYLEKLEFLGCRNSIFGYHGTIYHKRSSEMVVKDVLRGKGRNFPRAWKQRTVLHFNQALQVPTFVCQLGTGTVFCRGEKLPALKDMLGSQRRVDLRLARLCWKRGVDMVAVPRKFGWMESESFGEGETIYSDYTKNLPEEFLEELEAFALKVKKAGRVIKA